MNKIQGTSEKNPKHNEDRLASRDIAHNNTLRDPGCTKKRKRSWKNAVPLSREGRHLNIVYQTSRGECDSLMIRYFDSNIIKNTLSSKTALKERQGEQKDWNTRRWEECDQKPLQRWTKGVTNGFAGEKKMGKTQGTGKKTSSNWMVQTQEKSKGHEARKKRGG